MNKSRVYRIYWLVATILLAGAACSARLWQEATAFEGTYALPVPGATASVVLVCVWVMAAAFLAILAIHQPVMISPRAKLRGQRWDTSFFATGDPVFLGLMCISALCSLVAVPVLFSRGRTLWKAYQVAVSLKTWKGGDNGVLAMVTAGLALLAFFGLLQIGREGFRPGRRGKGGFWAALPACAGCGWLLGTYRNCAADPVLWDYVPLLLAVIAGMLMYIDWAGMSCAAARPRRMLWLSAMTVVCSWVALASQMDVGTTLLLVSQSVSALAALYCLPPNLQNPPAVGSEEKLNTPAAVMQSVETAMENKEEDTHE